MRTAKELYPQTALVYRCEVERCPACGSRLVSCSYHSGRKTVQTLSVAMRVAYQPKRCPDATCQGYGTVWKSAAWQQLAPLECSYGYDVIAQIGWQRQSYRETFGCIHEQLSKTVQISKSQVRHLYTYRYLPLIACHERVHWEELRALAAKQGLLLTLDGLAPAGGEPQLWLVRELRSGLTLRSGWMSEQSQIAFEHFLQPIVEQELQVPLVLSDKQRGLVPAIKAVFPKAKHAYCQSHYLRNLAEPLAAADEGLKVSFRKGVRQAIGEQIRREQVENQGVLTVTGLIPSPVAEPPAPTITPELTEQQAVAQEREAIVTAFQRRIRYLLTLKGRPPLRLAGLEMIERLNEVADCLDILLAHAAEPRLEHLLQGLRQALQDVMPHYQDLRQEADWLLHITDLLDPAGWPPRSGAEVRQQLCDFLAQIRQQSQEDPGHLAFAEHLIKTTHSYESGLFHTYDVADLPRTNNDRESEFRDLNRRLLTTTGQRGATKQLIQRSGAWELIPRPGSFAETVQAISQVDNLDFQHERHRVRTHRSRFNMHGRSAKQSQKLLRYLLERWLCLHPD